MKAAMKISRRLRVKPTSLYTLRAPLRKVTKTVHIPNG